MHYFAAEDATITVDFLVDGDFVVPDATSVSYKLRDNDGTVLETVSVTTDNTTTRLKLTIAAANNQTTSDVEKRSLVVEFSVDGQFYRKTQHYWLVSWLNFTANETNVRSLLGATAQELRDDEIDLVRSYFEVLEKVSTLPTALSSGTVNSMRANEAIAIKEALNHVPTLRYRLLAKQVSDTVQAQRYADPDFESLTSDLARRYSGLITKLSGDLETQIELFTLSSPSDPVTG